ncbi:uncharacterized protein FIBRA_01547 [Fibroporia radiculosa]|uniref:Protein ROT1 n=1 Tax=Fibroporia radiculosa TaxID=599839 RepID=J4H190_9APHY|nr:uncharacterized protein FIBRA_01547 [Fibroporia radiculosa]CCL99529.1 predicted protein [Fibroporia radiculosa]
MFKHIATSLLFSLAALAQDIVYTPIHNATTIYGTWSSGSGGVKTGPGFANPADRTFTYPNTTGISYSFTEDGFYEIARYRYTSNGSHPLCITGVMNWCHGTYQLMPNGSIIMSPFGDGFQQIQDACAAVSKFIETYNDTEYYTAWTIFQDPVLGYQLILDQYDGTPLAQQNLVTTSPDMLPTQNLFNVTKTASSDLAVSAGTRTLEWSFSSIAGLTTAVVAAGMASFAL